MTFCGQTDFSVVSVGLGEDENIFSWELMIVGPPDTLFEGGFFSAKLDFPPDFPNSPPTMTFKSQMWHPNGQCPLPVPLGVLIQLVSISV
jgi:ubiquitin-protein ligase